MEAPPILFHDGDALCGKSPISTGSIYTRKPVLHESVNVDALASACSVHIFPFSSSERKCSDTDGPMYYRGIVLPAYVGKDTLSDLYLAEVSSEAYFESVCVVMRMPSPLR